MNLSPSEQALDLLAKGTVIPAHLLALDEQRQFDEKRQRALTRYYVDSGAGGLAVGVHTTQFAIRTKGLYEKVLKIAVETANDWKKKPMAYVAGVAGKTEQAVNEARIAQRCGYHCAMINVGAFKGESEESILTHCRRVAEVMPIVGFYLLRECGGILLSYDFWKKFCEIKNVIAIKMAPFNRYQTLDVVRGVVAARAEERVTLYTGNDDHIVLDLVAPFDIPRDGSYVRVEVKGGLLGHWSVWTQKAVGLFERIQKEKLNPSPDLLALDSCVTDANSAIYDSKHDLRGAIPGCHYILHKQGLFNGTWCLDPNEIMSPGQQQEIDRIYREHPQMNDDDFVKRNLERWIQG